MNRPRTVLTGLLVLALLGGAGAAAVALLGDDDREAPPVTNGRPSEDVTLIAGSADLLTLTPTLLTPLTEPVTIEAVDRGAASARLGPVEINGSGSAAATIAWEGGTPLRIEPTGAAPGGLVLDPTSVRATTAGLEVELDGVSAHLAPGSYRVVGPVAVGDAGVARAADAVSFEATEQTVLTFDGPAVMRLPPEPVTLEGPGAVRMEGDFEVTTATSDRRESVLEFGSGPYRFDLVWVGDALEVDGEVRGSLVSRGGSETTPSQNST